MRVQVKLITPKMAAEMLGMNTANYRRLNIRRVAQYAAVMSLGKWELNGETIKVGLDGVLIDGQHRLAAIIKSGVSVKMAVATGVESSALNVDNGKPRTMGEWLQHVGVSNANAKAAIARLAWSYQNGSWTTVQTSQRPTYFELSEFVSKHDAAMQSAYVLAKRQSLVPVSSLSTILLYGCDLGIAEENETCRWFAEALRDGAALGGTEPVLHLRNAVIKSNASTRKLTKAAVVWLITSAWNKTVACEEVRGMRYSATGPKRNKPIRVIDVATDEVGKDE